MLHWAVNVICIRYFKSKTCFFSLKIEINLKFVLIGREHGFCVDRIVHFIESFDGKYFSIEVSLFNSLLGINSANSLVLTVTLTNSFLDISFKHETYFWGGLAPSSQTVGSLLITPWLAKWSDQSSNYIFKTLANIFWWLSSSIQVDKLYIDCMHLVKKYLFRKTQKSDRSLWQTHIFQQTVCCRLQNLING